MATNRTFTMLKPDAVEKGHIGAILEKITASGFRIVAMKLTQMTKKDAETFYAIHNERPFFGELVEMSTGSKLTLFSTAAFKQLGQRVAVNDDDARYERVDDVGGRS